MAQMIFSQWFVKRIVRSVVATVVFACALGVVLTRAIVTNSDPPAWATPNAMAIRRASSTAGAQSQPNFLDNLDCSLVTYRLAAGSSMQTGCFTETACSRVSG